MAAFGTEVNPTKAPFGMGVTPSLAFSPLMVTALWLEFPFAVRSLGERPTLALPAASNWTETVETARLLISLPPGVTGIICTVAVWEPDDTETPCEEYCTTIWPLATVNRLY